MGSVVLTVFEMFKKPKCAVVRIGRGQRTTHPLFTLECSCFVRLRPRLRSEKLN